MVIVTKYPGTPALPVELDCISPQQGPLSHKMCGTSTHRTGLKHYLTPWPPQQSIEWYRGSGVRWLARTGLRVRAPTGYTRGWGVHRQSPQSFVILHESALDLISRLPSR